MKDERTENEKYQAWLNATTIAWKSGWKCRAGWIFFSPSGTRHDLSAADFNKLEIIERDGLFKV